MHFWHENDGVVWDWSAKSVKVCVSFRAIVCNEQGSKLGCFANLYRENASLRGYGTFSPEIEKGPVGVA